MSQSIDLNGRRVAICEDEAMTVMQLRKVLPRYGMEVVGCAYNGQEAVDLVLTERPDIVLMDINMPVMDGIEATRRILSDLQTCVIMLTAYSDQETVREALDAGASGYIFKPSWGEDLVIEIEKALRHHQESLPGSASTDESRLATDLL